MFPDRFQADEEVESSIVIVELVYLKVFHLISPSTDLGTREG